MATTEQYSNVLSSQDPPATLNGTIGSGDGSLVVSSATLFPTIPQFHLVIEDEILLVTAVSGTTFTITRGAESTTPASHTSGVPVRIRLTKAALQGIGGSVNIDGTFASRPAAGTVGRFFLPSDGFASSRDNGTSWNSYGPIFLFTEPDDSIFSWVNQGTASVVTTNGGITLTMPGTGSSTNAALRVATAPSTPYTITVYFAHSILFNKQFTRMGLVFRESSTGKFVSMLLTDGTLYFTKWNSATAISADYSNFAVAQTINWYQITDDGTNLIFRVSGDGINFQQIETRARTNFLAGGPNQIGFLVSANNQGTPNFDATTTLLSWKQT